MTGDGRAIDAPVIEQTNDALREIERCRAAAPRIAFTDARPVERDHFEIVRETRRDVAPDLQRVGIAVQKNNRRSAAGAREADALSVNEIVVSGKHLPLYRAEAHPRRAHPTSRRN